MVITYSGAGHVRIQNGETTLVVDPVSTRAKATLTLRTSCDVNDPVPSDEIVCPGEYEVREVEVSGFATHTVETTLFTSYLIIWEEIRLFFLASSSPEFDITHFADVGTVDVLFAPADFGADPNTVAKLARQFNPAVIVPVYEKSTTALAQALGAKPVTTDKFVFKKKDLVAGALQFVVLEPLA